DPRLVGEPGLEDIASHPRNISIDVAEDLWVVADEDRLRQVLINLLTNALKYSEASTPIAIAARPQPVQARGRALQQATTSESPQVALSVRDYGLGVPPRDAPKLFQRFVRLDRDIAGPKRGTGVGLYLSRVLVEAMHGRIWVESKGTPGEGSTFVFT